MNKNMYLIELSESDKTDFGRIEFDKQSPVQRVFSAIWALESEVNGGGFSNYLTGFERCTASFAPTALRTIGALKCAEIVEAAIEVGADGDTSEFDQKFMRYPDNLTDLLFDFVLKHPEEFGPVDAAC